MLPEEDGLSILKKLRADGKTARLPIILLTAKSTEYDKVLGLDGGADDYMAKPFGMMELLSRIRALLRRTETAEEQFRAGDLTVVPAKLIVRVGEQDVALTQKIMRCSPLIPTREGIFPGTAHRERVGIRLHRRDPDRGRPCPHSAPEAGRRGRVHRDRPGLWL